MKFPLIVIVVIFAGLTSLAANAQAVEDKVADEVARAFAKAEELPFAEKVKLADALAQKHGRACLTAMVEMMIKNSDWPAKRFASILTAEVSDPDGRHKMLARFEELSDPRGIMVVAGIALPGDDEAKKLLIRAATAEYSQYSGLSHYACRFLRSFDQAMAQPAIEEAVRRDQKNSREQFDAFHRTELLAYFKYMDTLAPKDRVACMDFNRRFWWARAMSEMRTRFLDVEYRIAGRFFAEKFVSADEPFLRHALRFEGNEEEAAIAISIARECKVRNLEPALREYMKHGGRFAGLARLALRDMGFIEPESTQSISP